MGDNQVNRKKLWAIVLLLIAAAFVGNYAYGLWYSAEAYYVKGNELLEKDKRKEAIDAYTKAIEKDPKFIEAYIARAPLLYGEDRISDYNSLVNLEPQNPRWYQERAVCFRYAFPPKYDDAISDCEIALRLDPNYMPALLTRAEVYFIKKDYNSALVDCNRVVESGSDETKVEALKCRAAIYKALKDYVNAAADYTKVIQSEEKDYKKEKVRMITLYCRRGDMYRFAGDYSTALTDYTKVIERGESLRKEKPDGLNLNIVEDSLDNAYFGRGYIYHEQRDLVNAIENYTKDIELSSRADAYNNRGNCYADQGDYAQAVSDYTKAIEKGPKKAIYYNNRGIAHRRLGNMAQAEADFAKAQELEAKQ